MDNDQSNPDYYKDVLRQVLSQSRSNIGFLLGAGCPAAIKDKDGMPLIPAVDNLTTLVCDEVPAILKPVMTLIQEPLAAKLGRSANIEELLTRLRTLMEVFTEDTKPKASEIQALESYMCSRIAETVSVPLPPEGGSPFHALAHWIRQVERPNPVELFTTNYDLLIEQALEETYTPFFDGFVGSTNAFFDIDIVEASTFPSEWTRLWKLHGSINWRSINGNRFTRTSNNEASGTVVIYPSHLKYDQSRKLPFLVMLDRLISFLKKKPCDLFTIGYSFRDEHINALLIDGLARNLSSRVFALMYSDLESYPEATAIAKQRSNLILLGKNGATINRTILRWHPSALVQDNAAEDTIPEFTLGNFVKFGEFLEALTGVRLPETTHTNKAKQHEEAP